MDSEHCPGNDARKWASLRLPLACLAAPTFALLLAGCGGGGQDAEEPSVTIALEPYDALVWRGETVHVVINKDNAVGLGIDFSEVESGIDIVVADCDPPSALCERWEITPSASAIQGDYRIPIIDGQEQRLGVIEIVVFPAEPTQPATKVVTSEDSYDLALLEDGGVMTWGAVASIDRLDLKLFTGPFETLPRRVRSTNFEAGQFTDIVSAEFVIEPPPRMSPDDSEPAQPRAGAHSLGLRSDGSVWSWGDNSWRQLGRSHGSLPGGQFPPASVDWRNRAGDALPFGRALAIAVGVNQSLALEDDGTVWIWGNKRFGFEIPESDPVPERVAEVDGALAIAASNSHAIALLPGGEVWTWGTNGRGQLGRVDISSSFAPPEKVFGLPPVVEAVTSPSGRHNLALTGDGRVWSWGDNMFGQLGRATDSARDPVPAELPIDRVSTIAAGRDFSAVLRDDGTVWHWGSVEDNQAPTTTPQQLAGLTGARTIHAGRNHLYAISDHCGERIWAWNSPRPGNVFAKPQQTLVPVPGIGDLAPCSDDQDRLLTVYVSDLTANQDLAVVSDLGTLSCVQAPRQEGRANVAVCWQYLPFEHVPNLTVTAGGTPVADAVWAWDCSDASSSQTATVRMDHHKYCKVTLPRAELTAMLDIVVAGSGMVTSSDGRIDCGSACAAVYPLGTSVALTAIPGVGATFLGFTGAGCTTGEVLLDQDRVCTATFEGGSAVEITVNFNNSTGSGRVQDDTGRLDCTDTCAVSYDANQIGTVRLTQTAAAGSTFSRWDLCPRVNETGQGPVCEIDLDPARPFVEVEAIFLLQ